MGAEQELVTRIEQAYDRIGALLATAEDLGIVEMPRATVDVPTGRLSALEHSMLFTHREFTRGCAAAHEIAKLEKIASVVDAWEARLRVTITVAIDRTELFSRNGGRSATDQT